MRIGTAVKNGLNLNILGHAYNDIYLFIIPLLLPLLRAEFGLSYAQSGLILTTHIALRSFCTYLSGYLGDRYDKRVIIATGFVAASLFLGGLILAESITGIVACLVLLALGVATFHPLATSMVGERADPEHRALQIGIFESMGALGLVVASFTFGLLIRQWGWRQITLLLALPGFPLAWAYLRLRPWKGEDPGAEKSIEHRYILLFYLGRGIRFLGMSAFLAFLPTFGTDHLGLSAGVASWFITLYFAGCIFGALGGGRLADRTSPLLPVALATTILVPVLSSITYVSVPQISFFLVFICGILNGGFFTPQNAWLTTVSTDDTRGRILGAGFFVDGIFDTLAPTLFGWIADQIGLVGAYRWAVVPISISLLIFYTLYNLETQGGLYERRPVHSTQNQDPKAAH